MNLPETIKLIQGQCGVARDGVFGPATAAAVVRELARVGLLNPSAIPAEMDARSAKNLATLDESAQDYFREFYLLANATAASYGCTYILIEGDRTWEEQDRLYEIGRVTGGSRVTNAKGGQSNHNFKIAGDFGVFMGKTYLDESNPGKAAKVHKACSIHSEACGLEWGGSWKSITDLPHYEVATGLSMMRKRELFKKKGSVL